MSNWYIISSNLEGREKVRQNQEIKYSKEKECAYCGKKFDYGEDSLDCCLACKIIVFCALCNKKFELNLDSYSEQDQTVIKNAIKNKKRLSLFCSTKCYVATKRDVYSNKEINYFFSDKLNLCNDDLSKHI